MLDRASSAYQNCSCQGSVCPVNALRRIRTRHRQVSALPEGDPVRLEGLPLQLLIFLAEHSCQVVTRDEIAEALWGKNVFVDAETGINTAIRKVRAALDDDSAQPRYLQTVVGGDTALWPRLSQRHRNPGTFLSPPKNSARL